MYHSDDEIRRFTHHLQLLGLAARYRFVVHFEYAIRSDVRHRFMYADDACSKYAPMHLVCDKQFEYFTQAMVPNSTFENPRRILSLPAQQCTGFALTESESDIVLARMLDLPVLDLHTKN